MASTYTLIQSQTLASTAASVTFSAIPSTYTDLVLKMSTRVNAAQGLDNLWLTFNGVSGTSYSSTWLYAPTTSPTSSSQTSDAYIRLTNATVADNAIANLFSNDEIYIPSYVASQYKPISSSTAPEANNANNNRLVNAGLFSSTAAISSINITSQAGGSFMVYSSFYLYGISNA